MTFYLKQLLHWPIYLISPLIPKDDNIWIFSSWLSKTYSDNPKHLFKYIIEEHPEIKAYWITKDKDLHRELKSLGIPSFYIYSLKGVITQAFAGVAVFSHNDASEFIPAMTSKRTKRIQLWHGTPLKKIGAQAKSEFAKKHPHLHHLRDLIYPWLLKENYDLTIASSKEVATKIDTAFCTKKTAVTGYPRNDTININSIDRWSSTIKNIIYMPTFRGKPSSLESKNKTNSVVLEHLLLYKDELSDWFISNDINLVLKLHPSLKATDELINEIESLPWISFYSGPDDFYDIINQFDALITDYSSIFFDYMLCGKPVFHMAFDLDEYLESSRELYYEYNDLALTPYLKSWKDLTQLLDSIFKSGLDKCYIVKYNNILNKFNQFQDNKSSERVFQQIIELIK